MLIFSNKFQATDWTENKNDDLFPLLTENLHYYHRYTQAIRNRYHKKGAAYELPLGTKQSLNLVDSSNWTLDNLYNLRNKIAEPLLLYWSVKWLLDSPPCHIIIFLYLFFCLFFCQLIHLFLTGLQDTCWSTV